MTNISKMSKSLETIYREYVAAINVQADLSPFVHSTVTHNGIIMSCAQYMEMIKVSFDAAPDLVFKIDQLLTSTTSSHKKDGQTEGQNVDEIVSARICFDTTPISTFVGCEPLAGKKKKVSFAEHVWYRFHDGKVMEVWSLIDTEAVRKQLEEKE